MRRCRCRRIAPGPSACCCVSLSARRPIACGSRILDSRWPSPRPRVPSFYALDVMRAITGAIPHTETLQEYAAAEAARSLAWPAPAHPADAIDDLEHDLSVLSVLLEDEPRARSAATRIICCG